MENKKILYGVLIIVLVIAVVVVSSCTQNDDTTITITQEINSFDDCAKAGYPILESYPRQCKTPDGGSFIEELTPVPPSSQGASNPQCGIENCHGFDITCGANIPERCTALYQFGDRCRQFASCGIIDGSCELVKNAEFDECKSCVEKCSEDFKDDVIQKFSCESKCAE